ncbi:3-deoxy-D-manno-octulosonic acid transferase [Bordetella sputigena]|uniref:3-deoxy-D-manno-octulosonic acid transferase n=1 Tax=Bordetella sputigena TaxID=1416810 RepID=UPI0039EFD535
MNRTTYACILRACAPALAVRTLAKGRSDPLYSTALWERFGFGYALPTSGVAPVWIHAVSLGETRAAQPLVQELLKRRWPVILTHATATGRREGARLHGAAIDAGQLRQAWLPYDTPGACRRFLEEVAPSCGILLEREVWPNMIHEANARNVPMVLASARLSERSAKRGRYAGRVLRDAYAGLDRVLAQTEQDAERLRSSGARNVQVCGNIKFDMAAPGDQITLGRAWRQMWGRRVVVIASTHEGEEAAFIQAYMAREQGGRGTPGRHAGHAAQHREVPLLIMVPRHPDRFDAVAAQLAHSGLRWARRSAVDLLQPLPPATQILLGDSMGELYAYYAASDVAIVAGSFTAAGGQNLIEPCAVGTPVVMGPQARNFSQATLDALSSGAARRAADVADALDTAIKLLDNAPARAGMIAAGRDYVASHTGASERILGTVSQLLSERGLIPGKLGAVPRNIPALQFLF